MTKCYCSLPKGDAEMCSDCRDANGQEPHSYGQGQGSDWCFQMALQMKQALFPHFKVEFDKHLLITRALDLRGARY